MKILLTNDDGIFAEGIKSLAEELVKAGHEVIVLAPDQERSACSHSITIRSPLRVREVRDYVIPEDTYRVNGTPADCVKLGLHLFEDFEPDIIVSGINNGKNLGYDVFYSGTVSAAVEAHLHGYRSLAISLAVKKERNFTGAAKVLSEILKKSDRYGVFADSKDGPININVPDLPLEDIRGIKMTNLTPEIYDRAVEERVDPAGRSYFWFVGGNEEIEYPDSDINAVQDGFVSITPLKFDITDKKRKNQLNDLEDIDLQGGIG